MKIFLCGWLARSESLTLSFTCFLKKGSGTMVVYFGTVVYTVFSKTSSIFASKCVSLKLQFQHFVKKLKCY